MNDSTAYIITIVVGIVIVVAFGSFVFVVGHVPNTTDYPHKTTAEPSPYGGPCIDEQSLQDSNMTCSTSHAILQPAK
ncbi:MAG: hypothetical protein WAZ77_11345 [Candidatus Nitrosopolaris sp.]|jgi:hypothetical protein